MAALLDYLSAFVDHPLIVDDRVYASEAATGHRNRAIALPAAQRGRAHG